jgi:hypothetical protein
MVTECVGPMSGAGLWADIAKSAAAHSKESMLPMNMWHRFEKHSAANPTDSWLQMQAACATMAWLDAWAKLLLQHQSILEQQLAKFAPVVPGEGLLWHTPQRSDWSRPGTPLNPTGGRVSGQYLTVARSASAPGLTQHCS